MFFHLQPKIIIEFSDNYYKHMSMVVCETAVDIFYYMEKKRGFVMKNQMGSMGPSTGMKKCTGAEIVCECLLEQGVDTVFGYPGGQILNVYDALYMYSDRIKHYITSHEQGAAHAADGYARASGRVGVCIATSGPGATNLVTGIATAYMDSIPVVFITGNVPVALLGRDSFQEVDTAGITMPITKHNYIVKNAEDLASIIREAFLIARTGRPGPVLIDIPKDVQLASCDYENTPQDTAFVYENSYTDSDIDNIAELINQAERPLIYSGGGVILANAADRLRELSEKCGIPVCTSFMGKGVLPENHENYIGMIGMHGSVKSAKATEGCDLLLVLGARFSDRVAGNRTEFAKNAKIVHIDIDESEVNKNVFADFRIIGNVKDILKDINKKINPMKKELYTDKWDEKEIVDNGFTPKNILNLMSDKMPENTVVATDVGQHQMWTAQHFKVWGPRRFLSSGGLGTMGYGLGAALGAKALSKDSDVLLVTGDGSFHMNLNELSTAVNMDLPVTVLVMNNSVLGMVRQWQKLFFGSRFSSTTLNRKTDYVKLAEAFGGVGYRAEKLSDLEKIMADRPRDKTVVIDCVISSDENVLPMIPPGKTTGDIITKMEDE